MRSAFVLVVVLCGCNSASTPTAPPPTAKTIRYLAVGDSFTIGTGSPQTSSFPSRLADRWKAAGCTVELKNVAVNGFTTEDVIDEELPELGTFRPSFVTIAVGANDIVRGNTAEGYRVNTRKILAAVRASGAQVVVLPQPDWSRSPVAADFGDRESLASAIRRFNEILASEATAAGARYVDLSPLMEKQAIEKQVASDGLHPSAAAYDAWADALAKALPSPCP